MPNSLDTSLIHTLEKWSATQLQQKQNTALHGSLTLLKGDASTRRYYRACAQNNKSYIVVHAPPQTEKNHCFVSIARDWLTKGIRTPVIFAVNLEQGFLLLEDFGLHTLLSVLKRQPEKYITLYQQAMSVIHRIQTLDSPADLPLPRFDRSAMLKEMALFDEWVAEACLHTPRTGTQKTEIDHTLKLIIDSALEQPYTLVHKDYHSRNIMPTGESLGILDFQDAVIGPVTYDIVSLLRDCYIDWPETQVYKWLHEFARYTPSLKKVSQSKLHRWFDLMGLQRHLKVVGIFMRQWIMNGNKFYLQDIPRVFSYIDSVCNSYDELYPLKHWIEQTILPRLQQQSWWQEHQLEETL